MATKYRKHSVNFAALKQDINYVAEQFLRDPWAKEADSFTTPQIEFEISEAHVLLLRDRIPEYFVGYKMATRTPVFSHDIKLAKRIAESQRQHWEDALANDGVLVFPRWAE